MLVTRASSRSMIDANRTTAKAIQRHRYGEEVDESAAGLGGSWVAVIGRPRDPGFRQSPGRVPR